MPVLRRWSGSEKGAPGVTVTVAEPRVTPAVSAVTTWGPAAVALNLPVVVPDELVGPGWVRLTPAPVAASETDWPASAMPLGVADDDRDGRGVAAL